MVLYIFAFIKRANQPPNKPRVHKIKRT